MFDSKEAAQDHRDEVVEVLGEAFDGSPWHVHPVLDGAVVRIPIEDQDQATAAIEDHGFPIQELGETGDWFELKAKPQNDG